MIENVGGRFRAVVETAVVVVKTVVADDTVVVEDRVRVVEGVTVTVAEVCVTVVVTGALETVDVKVVVLVVTCARKQLQAEESGVPEGYLVRQRGCGTVDA